MRTLKLVLAIMMILSFPALAISSQGFARLSLTEGDVQIRVADSDEWLPATVNTPLYEGDSIWTPEDSRTEIQIRGGSVIRLDERSSLSIIKVDDDYLQFYLAMGRVYVRRGEIRKWEMRFDLLDSSVMVYDKSRLRIDITDRDEEEISVFSGEVHVETPGNSTRLVKGELLVVDGSHLEIYPVDDPDSWDRWNRKLDAKARKRTAYRGYLPEELSIYDEELASNGQWVQVREYGRVWRPTVGITADWAPYRHGHWIWRGDDYVWIPAEPWGWAPFHYGRWSFVSGIGWCWVPPERGDVYWSPAFVGWISTPSYIGWVPLAPGEKYYGHGHYGRHSVDIRKGSSFKFDRHSYRHEHLKNSVTGLNRSAFISGSGTYGRLDTRSLSRERIPAARPEPPHNVKELRMPRTRIVPPPKLPPPRVARTPIKELKERLQRPDRSRAERQRPLSGKDAPSRITAPQGTPSQIKRNTERIPRTERRRLGAERPVPADKTGSPVTRERQETPRIAPQEVKPPQTRRDTERSLRPEGRRPDAVMPVPADKSGSPVTRERQDTPRVAPQEVKPPQTRRDTERSPQPEGRRPEAVTPVPADKTGSPVTRERQDTPRVAPQEVKPPQTRRDTERSPRPGGRRPEAVTPVPAEKSVDPATRNRPVPARINPPEVKPPQAGPDSRAPLEPGVKPSSVQRTPPRVGTPADRQMRNRTPEKSQVEPSAAKQAESPANRNPSVKERRTQSPGGKIKVEKPGEKQQDSGENEAGKPRGNPWNDGKTKQEGR